MKTLFLILFLLWESPLQAQLNCSGGTFGCPDGFTQGRILFSDTTTVSVNAALQWDNTNQALLIAGTTGVSQGTLANEGGFFDVGSFVNNAGKGVLLGYSATNGYAVLSTNGTQDMIFATFISGTPTEGLRMSANGTANTSVGVRGRAPGSYSFYVNAGTAGVAGFFSTGSTTVSSLPAAALVPGQFIRVTDSTNVAAEGQTCVGSSTSTALAFSNGVAWKCF